MRKIVNTAVKITPGEKTFYIKNPVKSLNIPRMTPNRSHILQLFSCIEITIIPAQLELAHLKQFLTRLESLKLNINYYVQLAQLDDMDFSNNYLKPLIKQLPQVHKLTASKCLLHSMSFSEMFRGLKILVIQDSHIKFAPFAPQDLQQIFLKNTIIVSKLNSKTNDLKSLKTMILQDCHVNWTGFLTKYVNKSIIEHMAYINVEVKEDMDFCPLFQFSHFLNISIQKPNLMKYPNLKTLRLKGKIKEQNVEEFCKCLLKGAFPSLTYCSLHTVLSYVKLTPMLDRLLADKSTGMTRTTHQQEGRDLVTDTIHYRQLKVVIKHYN